MVTVKVHETEASNATLKAKVKASESKENAMRSELAELRERARDLAVKNGLMQHDIAHLTSALAVHSLLAPAPLPCALQQLLQHVRLCWSWCLLSFSCICWARDVR